MCRRGELRGSTSDVRNRKSRVRPPRSARSHSEIRSNQANHRFGCEPLIDILVEDLTERRHFGWKQNSSLLLGQTRRWHPHQRCCGRRAGGKKKRMKVIVPQGAVERAQLGLAFLKAAILELAKANPEGITNSDTASLLGLRSDYRGPQKTTFRTVSSVCYCGIGRLNGLITAPRAT